MSNQVLFNELPRPTFRWLQVNHTEGHVWGDRTAVAPIVVDAKAGIVSPIANPQPLKPAYAGANKSVLDAVMNATGDSYAIKVPAGAKESVKVAIKVESSHTQADARFLVEAGKTPKWKFSSTWRVIRKRPLRYSSSQKLLLKRGLK